VRDAVAACRSGLGSERREDPDNATQRKLALALLDEVGETATRLLAAFDEEDLAKRYDVVWLGEQGSASAGPTSGASARTRVLRVAPLSVGRLLRERLFGERTVVLTSATLTLGGSFDALARQWGLPPEKTPAATGAETRAGAGEADPVPDPDAPRWSGLDVGSPFDHSRAGILYVAKRLPPPGRDGLPPAYLDEIAALVEASNGGALGLFSSMRAAKQAAEALRGRLDQPILCQGDDATGLLVKRFAEDDATCLFGTLSLWQGVDVPGRSLRLVMIDRIPFPRPDDPLVSARQCAVDSRGGNGFLSVSATHAALLLAQGAGRLLRGMDDRGVVAVLDPRLVTARYAGFLRASLPPFWPTTDPEVVRAALRRLAVRT
ncbi:MAG: ATP-dependent DNA helicase, partial [Actinomycetota bacterium]|nr:ATP-dependent DNA helicase [Actinomycetota bacterium]